MLVSLIGRLFFTHITTDEQDLIYVFAPDVGNKERQQIDIFSHDGAYLYNGIVELEKRIQKVGQFVLNGEDLYTKAESENKNVRTVRYGIKIPKLNKEKSK